jgi:metal-dependent amidase/aminoacylase/carboxypeptidase family protein
MNDSKILQKVIDAAAQISMETHLRSYPFKWGEDFGLFTKKYPGVMFGVGAGINCPALHNPDYDFPDEIMPRIIDLYATIIKQELG